MKDQDFQLNIESLKAYGETVVKKQGSIMMNSVFTGKPEIFTYKTFMEMIEVLESTKAKVDKIKSSRAALDKKMRDSGY